jgi:hypothetical protein
VWKAGRLVDADLKYLQSSSQSTTPFVGGLDLVKYAKDRRVIPHATCGLADLCAKVLGKSLNKNVSECISQAWENETLTYDQLAYAAMDAYAALSIFKKLSSVDVPQPLPEDPRPLTPVLVYSMDNTVIIARGQISSHMSDVDAKCTNKATAKFDGITITSSHIIIDILEIFVPGTIISTHNRRALNSFGLVPFSVVVLHSHLRVFQPPSFHVSDTLATPTSTVSQPYNLTTSAKIPAGMVEESTEMSDSTSLADIVFERSKPDDELPMTPLNHLREPDAQSTADGKAILGTAPEASEWDNQIRSHVLKDPFHIFNMFRPPTNHGLRVEFARALRDALFIPDLTDRKQIEAWGSTQDPPCTFNQIRASNPSWVWRRCKHIIPPPHILHPLVSEVFHTYGPLKDAATSVPLFNQNNWRTAKNVLDLIKNGFVSDPPGIALYTIFGLDKKAGNLPLYRCCQGTNSTEGGVHTHLRSRLPTSGASVRHVHASMMDFVLRHNYLVCYFLFNFTYYKTS